jgi:uncharacterized protein YjiS (DUF1127 family)
MPALTALAIAAAVRARRSLQRLVERVKNRRDTMRLASLDDRMLADIGLNRSDLRDAFAELPWRDPSDVLVRRAAERRVGRGLMDPGSVSAARVTVSYGTTLPPWRGLPTDRPARYSV